MSLENNFLPYEQALALKELGFNELTIAFYSNDTRFHFKELLAGILSNECKAPLYQQAFQFLLDELEIISITYFNDGSGNLKEIGFNKRIVNFDTKLECLVELLNLLEKKQKYESN